MRYTSAAETATHEEPPSATTRRAIRLPSSRTSAARNVSTGTRPHRLTNGNREDAPLLRTPSGNSLTLALFPIHFSCLHNLKVFSHNRHPASEGSKIPA